MDKFFLRYVALCLVLLLVVNVAKACKMDSVSDEKIMNEYISCEYGEECYGTLHERTDDNYVEFTISKTNGQTYRAKVSRDHYTKQIIE